MIVHTSYLAQTSEFFASALKKEWAEGQTRIIDLDEETPGIMAHYLDWVYTTELPTKQCRSSDTESSKVVTKRFASGALCFWGAQTGFKAAQRRRY